MRMMAIYNSLILCWLSIVNMFKFIKVPVIFANVNSKVDESFVSMAE